MKTNKLFLMFALMLIGAIFISQEANANLVLYPNGSLFNETKTAYRGSFDINWSYWGMSATNMTFEIRRLYNESSFIRRFTLGNTSANQTLWNISQFNSAVYTDGNYSINITAWQNNTMGNTIISNVSTWVIQFDNSVPSAVIQSHSTGQVVSGSTQTFWLTDASVTNCTLVLWYNNAYTYVSNTSTATSGAGTTTPRSCTAVASSLPTGLLQAYFLSNDEANSTTGDQTFKITLTGGSGGGALTQQQTQLFQNNGTSATEGSGSAIVIILIVLGLIFFLKKKKRR